MITVERGLEWAVRNGLEVAKGVRGAESSARKVSEQFGGTPVRREVIVVYGDWEDQPNCPEEGCCRAPHGAGGPLSLHVNADGGTWE